MVGFAVVITSINPPTEAAKEIAAGLRSHHGSLIVIGDEKSPPSYNLEGARFYDLEAQTDSGFGFARLCPTRHYARKNIGYLIAMQERAPVIVETDDDNFPLATFWQAREPEVECAVLSDNGWTNIYAYFTEDRVWPRGLPLDEITRQLPAFESLSVRRLRCPIQQGLADDNPDVDAIYRLVLPLPLRFRTDRRVILAGNTWCPFNSQNTTWWPEAFPLLYLPSHCSFRMTDIWRSFVAQRIARANGWPILFHAPTVRQDRNEHDLLRDFADEVIGYLNNRKLCTALDTLDLPAGEDHIADNMRKSYRVLMDLGLVGTEEAALLDAWLYDLRELGTLRNG